MKRLLKIGDCFYDENLGRFLTIDSTHFDNKTFRVIEEELDESGEYAISGTLIMTAGELRSSRYRQI